MTDNELGRAGDAVRRTVGKILRRIAGLILLVLAIGLSTCQALDAVREPAPARIESSGE